MSRPQVIEDQEHERVHDRVAAIDVAKDSGMVCTRTPHPSRPGARRSTVWTVKARTGAVRALGRQLARDGIEIVTLESTEVIRGAKGRNWTLPRSFRRGRVRDGRTKAATTRGSDGISVAVGCLRRGRSPGNPSATGGGTGKADRHLPWQTALS